MKRIYKYPLPITGEVTLDMPIASELLSVKEQAGNIVAYAMVDVPDEGEPNTCRKIFRIVGTGHDADHLEGFRFIDTVKLMGGGLMFHVFVNDEAI